MNEVRWTKRLTDTEAENGQGYLQRTPAYSMDEAVITDVFKMLTDPDKAHGIK